MPRYRPAYLLLTLAVPLGCADTPADLGTQPLKLEPAALDFGEVAVGASASREVVIHNPAPGVVQISRLEPQGAWADDFHFELDRTSVAPGGSTSLRVLFSPSADGAATATLIISTDPEDAATVLTLRGRGASTPAPSRLCDLPDNLAFGNTVVGTTRSMAVDLCNEGDTDVRIELESGQNVKRCTSGSSDPSTFCIRGDDPRVGLDDAFILRPGETVTVDVDFSPVIAGTRERGAFTVRWCDSTLCEHEVRLDGLGVEAGLRCLPDELDLGDVTPGSCRTRNATCENIANTPITIVDWGAGASTSEAFSFEPARTLVLNEGDVEQFEVTFCPTAFGQHDGTLRIDTDVAPPFSEVLVALAGRGGGSEAEVLPAALDFGLVSRVAPVRRSILVLNVGVADLEIVSIDVDTSGTGAFTAPGAGPAVIPPGGSLEIVIEFLPVSDGPIMSQVVIHTSDPDQSQIVVPVSGEGVTLPPCSYDIIQAQIDFGDVLVPHARQAEFAVLNRGNANCLVSAVRLAPGSDPEFALPAGDVRSQIIAPGQTWTAPVTFKASAAGTVSGTVEISLSSPTSPVTQVSLTARGVDRGLLVAPSRLDFGTLDPNCHSGLRTVRIHNPGVSAATISALTLRPGSPFRLVQPPVLPYSIAPGDALTLQVEFDASGASESIEALQIVGTFEGAQAGAVVALRGAGATGGRHEERFEQLPNGKVDLLFVLDYSVGLVNDRDILAAAIPVLLQVAAGLGVEYRIGVTTSDADDEAGRLVHPLRPWEGAFSGPFSDRIITAASLPSPSSQFALHCQARPDSGGSARDESSFWATFLALSAPVITGHNSGLLREDAPLSILYLSDEPEQSNVGSGAPSSSLDFYVDHLRSLKGPRGASRVTASSIAGDSPSGCNGPSGGAGPGPNYREIARRTGGLFGSICSSDWNLTMSQMAPTLLGLRTTFPLENRPVQSTIEVVVDGVAVPAATPTGAVQWTFDWNAQAIQFSPFAIPAPGSVIVVRYVPECF